MSLSDVTSRFVTQASLADYTSPSLIIPDLRAVDTPGIIADLSHALQRHGCVPDVLPLYHAALNKELMENTAQECGVAFPHARLAGIKRLQFALGCAPRPVSWGTNCGSKADIIFLLAVPATDAANYLHLLASIARLGRRPDVLQRIRQAHTASGIISVLSTLPIGSKSLLQHV